MSSPATNAAYSQFLQAGALADGFLNVSVFADKASQGAGEASSGQYAANPVHELFIRDLASVVKNGVAPTLTAKIFGVLFSSSQNTSQIKDEGAKFAMKAQAQEIIKQMGKKYKEMMTEYATSKAQRLNEIAIAKEGEMTAQRQFGASIAGSKGMSAELRDSLVTLANDFNSTPADPYVNMVNAIS